SAMPTGVCCPDASTPRGGDEQTPSTHAPPSQSMPHPPQLWGSVCVASQPVSTCTTDAPGPSKGGAAPPPPPPPSCAGGTPARGPRQGERSTETRCSPRPHNVSRYAIKSERSSAVSDPIDPWAGVEHALKRPPRAR